MTERFILHCGPQIALERRRFGRDDVDAFVSDLRAAVRAWTPDVDDLAVAGRLSLLTADRLRELEAGAPFDLRRHEHYLWVDAVSVVLGIRREWLQLPDTAPGPEWTPQTPGWEMVRFGCELMSDMQLVADWVASRSTLAAIS